MYFLSKVYIMSLLTHASNYTSTTTNKRKSSLIQDIDNDNSSNSLNNVQKDNDERNDKIHKLIEEMQDLDESQTNLENFEPISNPQINVKKDNDESESSKEKQSRYFPNLNNNVDKLSNYSTIYTNSRVTDPNLEGFLNMKPSQNSNSNDLLLEKINYMIHMLEQQQHEKTSNITEDFILYSFLGIFVIYIVDSFTRSGKYKR